jgi:hypothetical protein
MLRKSVLVTIVVVAVALLAGCAKPTKLTGVLLLQPDLTGSPVAFVASKNNTISNSPFEFADVIEGYYYVLAWKDLNGDGVVSDKDIVGVHGGSYKPGYGGSMVTVNKGKTTDVGEIEMLIYKELKIAATGVRTNGEQVTEFSYSFNYDVTLTSLTIAWPDGGSNSDPGAPGTKIAGTTYTSIWNAGGVEMPVGNHILTFVGTFDGVAFDVDVQVGVQ